MSTGGGSDGSMDDIMATIRRIVADAPPPPLGEVTMKPTPALAPPASVAPVETPASPTIDAFLRSMLEPMLRQWLDANLPEIVERVTEAEIRRLTKTEE